MHIGRSILVSLAALAALPLRPAAARAIEHQSARIYSLGGDRVAGVIPDLYTDIGVNPAYAFFADRLNVSLARRYDPGYDPALPYLMDGSGAISGASMMVNEISAWGIGLPSWRAAVFVQWALDRPEGVSSTPRTRFDDGVYVEYREDAYEGNNDFAMVDISGARALGDRTALGLRIRGRVCDYLNSRLSTRVSETYDDLYFTDLEGQRRTTDLQSYYGRRYSLDLQAGIARSDERGPRTDFAITASFNRPDHRQEQYYLDIGKEFYPPNELDSYAYSRSYWKDARAGDIWSLALMFRHSFDGGIRVLAGGDISTCRYETDWVASEERLQWGSWSDLDQKVTGALDGDGDLLDGSCYIKGSRVFSIHRTTDLYLGLHGVYARIRAEEEPLVHYTIRGSEGESAVSIDQAVQLESIEESFAIYVPLSVEFRPSSWFSYFSSVVLRGNWQKISTTQPILSLFTYRPPVSLSRIGGANLAETASAAAIDDPAAYSTEWRRELSTGAAVTLGFSLHYGDKFFVDVYTESDIVPTYLDNNVIDVRYAF